MSRTIRRKGMKSLWPSDWTKAYGYDWEYDAPFFFLPAKRGGFVTRQSYAIRERTPREKFERWYLVHGESKTASARSPNKHHRAHRNAEQRTHNKTELWKELNRPDYEGLYWANPLSCWWDWS